MAKLLGENAGYVPATQTKYRQSIGSNAISPTPSGGVPISTPSLGGPVGSGAPTVSSITPIQNYQSDVLGDQLSQAAQGAFSSTVSGLASARADAIQRAIVSGGWTPASGSLGAYAGDVTPQTLAQAAANPMSQKAQLDLQLSQAQQNTPYDLAASGAGRSGASAIAANNQQQQYQTASYQGLQDMLNNIYSAGNTYATGYNNALGSLQQQQANAAYLLAQQSGYSQPLDGTNPGGTEQTAPTPQGGYAPATSQVVQRVIQALGPTKNPRAGQTLRNVLAG